jgi:hypothetical protein
VILPPKLTHLRIIVLVAPILSQRNVVVSLVFSVLHLLVSRFAGASYDGDDRRRRVFSSCVVHLTNQKYRSCMYTLVSSR